MNAKTKMEILREKQGGMNIVVRKRRKGKWRGVRVYKGENLDILACEEDSRLPRVPRAFLPFLLSSTNSRKITPKKNLSYTSLLLLHPCYLFPFLFFFSVDEYMFEYSKLVVLLYILYLIRCNLHLDTSMTKIISMCIKQHK